VSWALHLSAHFASRPSRAGTITGTAGSMRSLDHACAGETDAQARERWYFVGKSAGMGEPGKSEFAKIPQNRERSATPGLKLTSKAGPASLRRIHVSFRKYFDFGIRPGLVRVYGAGQCSGSVADRIWRSWV
jgi:hypothetical protein